MKKKFLYPAFILLSMQLTSVAYSSDASQDEHRIHLWVKAFIPKKHPKLPDYIVQTKSGVSAIPAPKLPGILDFDKLSGTCFSTDNRDFDSSPTSSARVTLELVLVIKGRELFIESFPDRERIRIGETHNVDCISGKLLRDPLKESENSVSIGDVKKNGFRRTFFARATSSNPYYTLFGFTVSPSVDFSFSIAYDALFRTITVDGMVGYFPAFEGYYSLDGGKVHPLFKLSPFDDSTAMSLVDLNLGVNTRNIKSTIEVK